MTDIFDNTILCKRCGAKMQKAKIAKNGFLFRAVVCSKDGCSEKIIHPVDEQEYNKFINLKNMIFKLSNLLDYLLYQTDKPFVSLTEEIHHIEDYIALEDYLHPVNQTYEIKLRQEGFSNLTPQDVTSKEGNGVLAKLRKIWQEHTDDDWEEFDNEEITRYICEKITLEEANFLSDKTKDQFRTLYRLIAERIRQYQNVATKPDLDKFQKAKA